MHRRPFRPPFHFTPRSLNDLFQKIRREGFAEPIRCYKVLALYDDFVSEGTVIREEADGFKVLLDLQKRDRAEAVAALEAIVARLKG